MTTVVWKDFETGGQGIIQLCQGHADGPVESTNIWRPTVTYPYHSTTTSSSPPTTAPQQRDSHSASSGGISSVMATSTLVPDNDALKLMPLRQQIIANATVLFPLVVKGKHNTLFRWGHASPDVLFEIAILATTTNSEAHALAEGAAAATKYQAILTHGLVTKQQTAAMGDVSASVLGAMDSLLGVLCFELGKRKDEAVAAIGESNRVRSLGGYVNGGLFQKVGLAKKVKGKKA